jgi:hypothetical protein
MRTTGHTLRAFLVVALFLLGCFVSRASAQNRPASQDSAFFGEFPLAWVYRGVALYTAKDYEGAIKAWQNYLPHAANGRDSTGVDELIRDAWMHAYPMSLVYDGYARYLDKDFAGAIAALELYIQLAPAGTDTVAIRQVIVQRLVPAQEMEKVSTEIHGQPNRAGQLQDKR